MRFNPDLHACQNVYKAAFRIAVNCGIILVSGRDLNLAIFKDPLFKKILSKNPFQKLQNVLRFIHLITSFDLFEPSS